MQRRRFLTYVVGAPLGAMLPLGCRRRRPDEVATPAKSSALIGAGVVLDPLQLKTLEAACARIIPTDADPGATEAGAAAYIDAQLAHPPVSGFRRLLTTGLKRVQFIAKRVHRASFADLSPDKQDKVLTLSQRGRGPAQRFLPILVVLTIEGFLGDPVYGGNRDQVGWKLVGFTPQSPGPRAAYRGRHLG